MTMCIIPSHFFSGLQEWYSSAVFWGNIFDITLEMIAVTGIRLHKDTPVPSRNIEALTLTPRTDVRNIGSSRRFVFFSRYYYPM